MAKVSTEIRRMAPELVEAIKLIEILARKRNYAQVFSDLIDWAIAMHHFPPIDFDLSQFYDKEDQDRIPEIWKLIVIEYRKRVSLWTGVYTPTNWYDGLGRMYEALTSKGKSSILGQYFTPDSVVNMMAMINKPAKPNDYCSIYEPCCGSGRLGLAASMYAVSNKSVPIMSLNDIDSICTKMTTLNFCLHGLVAEVTCMDAYDPIGKSYRFGYRVRPILSYFPPEQHAFYIMTLGMQTGQSVRKSYVIEPLSYEQTMLKKVNDNLLKQMEADKIRYEREEKERKLNEMKETVAKGMEGTLFEGDQTQLENLAEKVKKDLEKKKVKKKKNKPDEDDQLSLF